MWSSSSLVTPYTPSSNPAASTVPAYVPPDPLSQSAYAHAQAPLHPAILAHSLRVFQYAYILAQHERSAYGDPAAPEHALLFAACTFHDIGTSDAHNTGPARFEVEGADAAVAFLARSDSAQQRFTAAQRHALWVAIAVHTSAHIAEQIDALARLLRTAVLIDFEGPGERRPFAKMLGRSGGGGGGGGEKAQSPSASADVIAEIEERCPRGPIEKVLGNAVVEQALRCAEKGPAASWPGVMLRSKRENMEWDGVNKEF